MLRIEDQNGVRLLTLDRPDALNAFNTPLYDACAAAFHEASERDDIACVVLTGTGRAFSAGQDLGEWSSIDTTGSSPATDDPGPGFPRFIDTVAAFEKPLLAAVNGLGCNWRDMRVDGLITAAVAERKRQPKLPFRA